MTSRITGTGEGQVRARGRRIPTSDILTAPPSVLVAADTAPGASVRLDPEDAAHLRVLRLGPGAVLRGVDGEGFEYALRLRAAGGCDAEAIVESRQRSRRELVADVWLLQGALHTARMDLVIEKAAELGVRGVLVVRAERSQHDAPYARIERWRRIARSAMLQSLGATFTEVAVASDLAAALGKLLPQSLVLADPAGDPDVATALRGAGRIVVAVGPEGGFTDAEHAALVAAGARAVSLGARRLRAETAAIVLVGAVAGYLGVPTTQPSS